MSDQIQAQSFSRVGKVMLSACMIMAVVIVLLAVTRKRPEGGPGPDAMEHYTSSYSTDAPGAPRRANAAAKVEAVAITPAALQLLVPTPPAAPGAAQLVVFVQPDASPLQADFIDTKLPPIRQMAADLGIDVVVRDIRQGAPEEVRLTPLLVFQNHLGRSTYQGRTTTPDRVHNFLRTSRFVPQDTTPMVRHGVPVMQLGRAQVWSPLKLADVTGTPPAGYDRATFVQEATAGLRQGFTTFAIEPDVTVRRSDRGFYMDFYPWLSDDGTLFLSLALYSEFHCKHPVYELKTEPLTGPWQDRAALYARAATLMQAAVQEQLHKVDGGDGFDPVPANVPVVTWEALGLPLPSAPAPVAGQTVPAAADLKLVQNWQVVPVGKMDKPPVLFHFPAPLDNFAGEATGADGTLGLGDGLSMNGASGRFTVEMKSVTMGEPDLDDALQSSTFLNTKQYPRASFQLKETGFVDPTIAFGKLTAGTLTGEFTFKDKTIPTTAVVELEPVVNADAQLVLLLRGTFQMNLLDFGLNPGLDGPENAKHTLMFELNFQLQPQIRTTP